MKYSYTITNILLDKDKPDKYILYFHGAINFTSDKIELFRAKFGKDFKIGRDGYTPQIPVSIEVNKDTFEKLELLKNDKPNKYKSMCIDLYDKAKLIINKQYSQYS